jgi:hypothetical protein
LHEDKTRSELALALLSSSAVQQEVQLGRNESRRRLLSHPAAVGMKVQHFNLNHRNVILITKTIDVSLPASLLFAATIGETQIRIALRSVKHLAEELKDVLFY